MPKVLQNVSFILDTKSVQEVKQDDGMFATFSGYASVFNNVDQTHDIVLPGAFTNSIRSGRKIKMLWNHQSMEVIGSYPEMEEDDKGLFVKGRLNLGVKRAEEAYALLKAGDMDGLSIGFYTKDYDFNDRGMRMIKEADLREISIVASPANEMATVVDVKSVREAQTMQDLERMLTEQGFSQKAAKAFLSSAVDIKNQRRDGADGDKPEATTGRDGLEEKTDLSAYRLTMHIRNEIAKIKGTTHG